MQSRNRSDVVKTTKKQPGLFQLDKTAEIGKLVDIAIFVPFVNL